MKKKVVIILALFLANLSIGQEGISQKNNAKKENTSLGVMGITYTKNSDLGIAAEINLDAYFIFGMLFSMNLDSYTGIGEELNYATVTELGKLTTEPEYKQMSIAFLGGLQLNTTFALVGGLGYTHKTEYYRMDTDYGYSKVAYHYHVETGKLYGELYASLKARVRLANFLALSIGVSTNGTQYGVYYRF